MKALYKFKLYKEKTVETPVEKTDEAGNKIKVLEPKIEKEELIYFIRKPTRELVEKAELFYASKVSEAIKMGILSAPSLQKRFINDDGILSEDQKKKYEGLFNELFEKQALHKQLTAKVNQTEEDKNEVNKVFDSIVNILTEIQRIESQVGNVVSQNTAENIARNRTSFWWTLYLSYQEIGDKNIPVFGDGSYEDKLKKYDKVEQDEDEFELKLVNKLFLITSLWYLGKAETQDDFDLRIKMYENNELINAVAALGPEEEKKEDKQLQLAV